MAPGATSHIVEFTKDGLRIKAWTTNSNLSPGVFHNKVNRPKTLTEFLRNQIFRCVLASLYIYPVYSHENHVAIVLINESYLRR